MAYNSSNNVITTSTTTSSGAYELKSFGAGSYKVSVLINGTIVAKNDNVSVTDAQTTTCNLSAFGGSIQGTIADTGKNGISGAEVSILTSSGLNLTTTNSTGDYILSHLPAGTFQVVAKAPGFAAKNIEVTIITNQHAERTFVLTAEGLINGTVKNSSQVAIEGATVIAVFDDPNNPNPISLYAATDVNGNYTLSGLKTGNYTVTVSAENYVSDSEEDIAVTAGQTTPGKNFTLGTSGGTISGTVYQSDGQTPISNAFVTVSSTGESSGSTMTDGNGQYSISLLQAGTYTVIGYASGYEINLLNNVTVTQGQESSGNNLSLTSE